MIGAGDTAKIVLLAGAVVAVVWAGKKLTDAAGAAVEKAGELAQQVNPLNPDNIFAGSVNEVGSVLVTEPDGNGKNADGSWSLGGWLYDVTHGGIVKP